MISSLCNAICTGEKLVNHPSTPKPKSLYATFRIVGTDLVPSEINALLQLTATSKRARGEMVLVSNKPSETGYWLLETEDSPSRKFKDHLNELIDKLETKIGILEELQKRGFQMSFSAYAMAESENVELHMDIATLKRLSAFPSTLWFDMYFNVE